MKDFDLEALAAELKLAVVYGDDPRCHGAVKRVARIMGLSPWTVRDYFDGKIKASLPFLHALAIATDGAVAWPLEPEGFRLVRDQAVTTPLKEAEPELTDVILSAGATIRKVREITDPESDGGRRVTRQEAGNLDRCLAEMERELTEARAAVSKLIGNERRREVPVA